jgi:hypothetical protein
LQQAYGEMLSGRAPADEGWMMSLQDLGADSR